MGKALKMEEPIVLLGGGHAHVEVVRQPGSLGLGPEIILVSPSRHAPYSGMLPAYVSGQYRFEDFYIDLVALCARYSVTFLATTASGIDPDRRQVTLPDGQVLDYSLLSIDIGSTPSLPPGVSGGISVKPIASFTQCLDQLDARAAEKAGPLRLAVVGHGVAGIEMAFALKRRLGPSRVEILLAGRAGEVITAQSPRPPDGGERTRTSRFCTSPAFRRDGLPRGRTHRPRRAQAGGR